MIHRMKVVLLLWAVLSVVSQAKWPTYDFEIKQDGPSFIDDFKAGVEDFNASGAYKTDGKKIREEDIPKIKSFLHKVATHYDLIGFPEPKIDTKTSNAYIIYALRLIDPSKASTIAEAVIDEAVLKSETLEVGRSLGLYHYIVINTDLFLTENLTIPPDAWEALPHELFHAVSYNTTFCKGERVKIAYGNWHIEGLAKAIGIDMARIYHPPGWNEEKTAADSVDRWGLRNYAVPLYMKESMSYIVPSYEGDPTAKPGWAAAYKTSSFWRYIAESWHLKVSGKEVIAPGPDIWEGYYTDYSIFAKLMDKAIDKPGEIAEMRWVDNWLRETLKKNLATVYTEFVAVFAEYGRYRTKGSIRKYGKEKAAQKWLEYGFRKEKEGEACPVIQVSSDATSNMLKLYIERIAARCVTIDTTSLATNATYKIKATIESEDKTLHLAMAGGQQISMNSDTGYTKKGNLFESTWTLEIEGGKENILLITNVSTQTNPAKHTKAQTFTIRAGLTYHESSETKRVPPSKKKSRKAKRKKKVKPGPEGAEAAHFNRHQTMYKPATTGSDSIKLKKSGDEMCMELDYDPDYIDPFSEEEMIRGLGNRTEHSVGGRMKSALNGLSLLTGTPNALGLSTVAQNEEKAKKMAVHGSRNGERTIETTICFPKIEYGFKGTLPARILVRDTDPANDAGIERYEFATWGFEFNADKTGGRVPVPVPPKHGGVSQSCREKQETGTITIESFTRYSFKGSYKAQLFATYAVPVNIDGGTIVYLAKCSSQGTTSGRFHVAAPYLKLDNARKVANEKELIVEGLEAATGVSGLGELIFGTDDEDEESSGSTSGVVVGNCDCSCAAYKAYNTLLEKENKGEKLTPEEEKRLKKYESCMPQCMMKMMECEDE